MVVAQRGPQQARRTLTVLLLASVLLGTASAAAGGFLFKGKDSTYIKRSSSKKESVVCDASAVPSFVRLALRYRGGETKPAEHNASAGGNVLSVASEADDSEEEGSENGEEKVVAADTDTPVEGEQEAAAAGGAAAAAAAEEGEDSFHDAVEAAAEGEDAAPTAAAAAAAAAVAAVDEEGDDDAEKAEAAELAALASVTQELSGPEAVRRKRAETGDNMKKDKYNAKMQWVITNKMKKILREELHYEAEEVEAMMPDVAAVVINKHLERPKRGMPPEWRKDFHLRQRGWKGVQASLKHALRRVVEEPQGLVRGVGTAAVAAVGAGLAKRWVEGRMEGGGGEEEEWEWVEMTPWEEMVDRIQSRLPGRGRK